MPETELDEKELTAILKIWRMGSSSGLPSVVSVFNEKNPAGKRIEIRDVVKYINQESQFYNPWFKTEVDSIRMERAFVVEEATFKSAINEERPNATAQKFILERVLGGVYGAQQRNRTRSNQGKKNGTISLPTFSKGPEEPSEEDEA